MDAPCGQCSGGDHREGKPEAETNYQGEAQHKFLQLEADQQHGQRRRAGHQSAGKAEKYDLTGAHRAIGKPLRDIGRMCLFVGILVLAAGQIHPAVRVMMVGLAKLEIKAVGVVVVRYRQGRIELVRFGQFDRRP